MKQQQLIECPYLSSIRRYLLDFDFEKVCSVTMATNNIYGCLVCGRYFQGRVTSSAAYNHSIQHNHYIFINLHSSKIYCLPDNYEVISHTTQDITYNLFPTFTQQLHNLYNSELYYTIEGKQYYPGIIGINNLTNTDYASCVFQLLNAVTRLRQYFLLGSKKQSLRDDSLLDQFELLLRKIWNPRNFKGIVSPHSIMQLISEKSDKLYKIGKSSDPSKFIVWLLNNLSTEMKKQKLKPNIMSLFQGSLKTSFLKCIAHSAEYESIPTKVDQKPFIILNLEFPQKGIFNKIKNQISIESLMENYSGTKGTPVTDGIRYIKVTQYPPYLILSFRRFLNNGYVTEKDSSQLIYNQTLILQENHQNIEYHLIAQISHEGTYQTGGYRSYVLRGQKWFSAYDLEIKQILKKQMLLAQPSIQLYMRNNHPHKN